MNKMKKQYMKMRLLLHKSEENSKDKEKLTE